MFVGARAVTETVTGRDFNKTVTGHGGFFTADRFRSWVQRARALATVTVPVTGFYRDRSRFFCTLTGHGFYRCDRSR